MKNILIIGFYGVVKEEDMKFVFGPNAIRIPFKKRKSFIFKAKWPEDWTANKYVDISEKELLSSYHFFIKTISRFSIYSGWDLDSIDVHFYKVFIHAFTYLKKNNIKIVIFQDPPHTAWEVVIYSLSKIHGVKTIICRQSPLFNAFFAMSELGDSRYYISSDKKYNLPNDWLIYNDNKSDWFYMKNIKIEENIYYRYAFNVFISIYKGLILRKPYYFKPFKSLINDIGLFFEFKKERKNSTLTVEEMPADFVYVPLHLQPEMTTSALGGKYYNQLFMVYQLRTILPKEVPIVIKENPKQWVNGRGFGFYSSIRKIKNVYHADIKEDSVDLIHKSICTATVTGTAGWETLKIGKPVIYFGSPWWSQIYGAFKEEKNVYKKVKEFIPNQDKFRQSVSLLSNKLFQGSVINSYRYQLPELSYEKNIQLLESSFKSVLKSI